MTGAMKAALLELAAMKAALLELAIRLNEAQGTLGAVRADLAELSGLDLDRSLGDHIDAIRHTVAPARHIRHRRYHSPSPFIRPRGDSRE